MNRPSKKGVERPDTQTIRLEHFSIVVDKEGDVDKFLNELEVLCKKHALKSNSSIANWYFNFKVEG